MNQFRNPEYGNHALLEQLYWRALEFGDIEAADSYRRAYVSSLQAKDAAQ